MMAGAAAAAAAAASGAADVSVERLLSRIPKWSCPKLRLQTFYTAQCANVHQVNIYLIAWLRIFPRIEYLPKQKVIGAFAQLFSDPE